VTNARSLAHFPKKWRFLILLGIALTIAAAVSLGLRLTLLSPKPQGDLKIAVIAPLSGPHAAQGQAIKDGVQVLVNQINEMDKLDGRQISLTSVDEALNPSDIAAQVARLAADPAVMATVGHWSGESAHTATPVYQAQNLPAFLLSNPESSAPEGRPWVFHTIFDDLFEARFLSNYVRNVIGEKNVSIILANDPHQTAMADAFDEILQRFGTRVVYRWSYDLAANGGAVQAEQIAAEIDDKKIAGALIVLGDARPAADVVAALRARGVTNKIVGSRSMASAAFSAAMKDVWKGKGTVQSALNGVMVSTPILFDTAGELAQKMRNDAIQDTGHAPDWVAAYAYDAARVVVLAVLDEAIAHPGVTGAALRASLREKILSYDRPENAFVGAGGDLFFNRQGFSSRPVMMGNFDGGDLVAALTQLSPIRDEGVANYIQEVLAGRALYVNDRFMYKTNVVYSGIRLDKVSAMDSSSNIAELDFLIWFRWRGKLDPEDIVFVNAVAPIKMDRDRDGQEGDMLYRAYRVRGKFYMNYTSSPRPYGDQLVGLAFHHRLLGSNNLMYVSDTLGMNLTDNNGLANQLRHSNLSVSTVSTSSTLVSSLHQAVGALGGGAADVADPLLKALNRSNVLVGLNGWLIDKAWVSQDLVMQNSEGNPVFVGFGKPRPTFSTMDFGIQLKPDAVSARDFLSHENFVYLGVFAAFAAILAAILDNKERGQFWRAQSLFLRILSWPLLLLALDNLGRDYSLAHFTLSTVDSVVMGFNVLWWLIPTRLFIIVMERFIWVPLENRSGRKVPNLIRQSTALIIILLMIFGVIAFVFNKPLTSLLATSGLVTMIIGLSIQANLRDVFAGVILHLERPFGMGDYVKINNIIGNIVDITWRTIRIKADDGFIICFPNGKTADAEIQNFTKVAFWSMPLVVQIDAAHDPEKVLALLWECVNEMPEVLRAPQADEPIINYAGVEMITGVWSARYTMRFSIPRMGLRAGISTIFWKKLWQKLEVHGIRWLPPAEDGSDLTALPAPR